MERTWGSFREEAIYWLKAKAKQRQQLEVFVCAAAVIFFLDVLQYAKALHMSRVLTVNKDALGGLQFLVVRQGAFIFTCILSVDGSQSVGV